MGECGLVKRVWILRALRVDYVAFDLWLEAPSMRSTLFSLHPQSYWSKMLASWTRCIWVVISFELPSKKTNKFGALAIYSRDEGDLRCNRVLLHRDCLAINRPGVSAEIWECDGALVEIYYPPPIDKGVDENLCKMLPHKLVVAEIFIDNILLELLVSKTIMLLCNSLDFVAFIGTRLTVFTFFSKSGKLKMMVFSLLSTSAIWTMSSSLSEVLSRSFIKSLI